MGSIRESVVQGTRALFQLLGADSRHSHSDRAVTPHTPHVPGAFPDDHSSTSPATSSESQATACHSNSSLFVTTGVWAQERSTIDKTHLHLLNPSPAKTGGQHGRLEKIKHRVPLGGTMRTVHASPKQKSPRRQFKDAYRGQMTARKDPGVDHSCVFNSPRISHSLHGVNSLPDAQPALEKAQNNARASILNSLERVGSPFSDDVFSGIHPSNGHIEDDEPPLSISHLTISDEKESDLGDHGAQQQLHADQQDQDHRRECERIEKEKRIAAEKLREMGGLRLPRQRLVTDLVGDWRKKIMSTLSQGNDAIVQTKSGNTLRARDFEKVIHPQAWLNDEIVNGSLEWLDDYVNTSTTSTSRKCLSFSSFLWPRIKSGQSTDRILRRVGILNPALFLDLETMLIPICANNHWTLVVVRPRARTVAHMDSMNQGGSPSVLKATREWVKHVCGDKFVEEQWSIAKYQAPLQINGNDCGAHVITNGVCIAMGVDPAKAYTAKDMPLQRLRIAGMLLSQGFKGDFELGKL